MGTLKTFLVGNRKPVPMIHHRDRRLQSAHINATSIARSLVIGLTGYEAPCIAQAESQHHRLAKCNTKHGISTKVSCDAESSPDCTAGMRFEIHLFFSPQNNFNQKRVCVNQLLSSAFP
jgi:hypothetical protein